MLKNSIIVFVMLFLFSCGSEEVASLPTNILDKNKMAEVMTDLSLAESIISIKQVQSPAMNVDSLIKFNIFKQHNISKKQYEDNIDYYSAHPVEFKEVYDLVAKRIEGIKK
jgi:PIN domain nuclease of toxin-antitoxin system